MSTPDPAPRILLDANALWSPVLRDTLLRAAEDQLYQPLWSSEILQEMVHTILSKRPTVRAENLARTVARMQTTFPDATISGHDQIMSQLTNHPGDRHVLAAAIHGRAESIVTWNRRHFLPTAEQDHGMTVLTPDAFLCQLLQRHPEQIHQLLIRQGAALRSPVPFDVTLLSLRRAGVGRFAELIQRDLRSQ